MAKLFEQEEYYALGEFTVDVFYERIDEKLVIFYSWKWNKFSKNHPGCNQHVGLGSFQLSRNGGPFPVKPVI